MRPLIFLTFALAAWPQTGEQLALESRRARELMQAGRYAEAIPIYQGLVKAVPNEPRLLLNLGLAQQMAGRCTEAIAPLSAAAKAMPGSLPAWSTLGACHLELGSPSRAIAPLEKAAALAPREPEPLRMLAGALFSSGRFEAASERYRQLTSLQPSDPSAWYGLGKSYEALAGRAFERLQKLEPDSAFAFALAAEAQAARGQYATAADLYNKALARKPGLRGANAALAEVYRAAGQPDRSAAAAQKEAALRKPDCASARQECAFREGRYLDAARASQAPSAESLYWQARAWEALAADAFGRLSKLPPSVESHRLAAQIASERNDPVQAVAELQQAVNLAPGDRQLQTELAAAMHQARDHAGARAVLTRLLGQDPTSPLLNFMLGDTLLELGEVEAAVPYLEKGAVRGPQAKGALGIAYARSGRLAKALPYLEAGAPADTDGRIHFQLARAYREAGRAAEAKAAMEKYQALQARTSGSAR